MLVLSRKIGEEILIGERIRVTVQRVSGNRVSLGIEAPREIRIIRGELAPMVDDFSEPSEPSDEQISGLVIRIVRADDDAADAAFRRAPIPR